MNTPAPDITVSPGLDRLAGMAGIAGVVLPVVLIVVKLAGFLLTGSVAVLSSLVDSATDALSGLVTLVGVRKARAPADPVHRFGHGKAEPLAGLAQAGFIGGSAVFLVFETINRILSPVPLEATGTGIAIMVFAIAGTALVALFQHYAARKTASVALKAAALNYTADLLTQTGVIAALFLAGSTGILLFDSMFAMALAAWMLWNAVTIALECARMLMDAEMGEEDRARIEAIVNAHPETRGLHDLRTRASGTVCFIEFHLELDGKLTLEVAHDITDEVEREVSAAFDGAEVMIHQEPAGIEDERLDTRIAAQ